MILGIDEVGRGPWAGPLVIGAVVLGSASIDGLTDSKKLTKKRRGELDVIIREQADGYGLGWVSAAEIDEIGLSAALVLATKRAVEQVSAPYHEIIIDGTINFLKDTSKGQYVTTLKKADLLIPSVSAASIIAKVARDNYMAEQDEAYPGYKFSSHVGYGTAVHRTAIEQLGVTPLHRLSFAPLAKYRLNRPVHGQDGFAPRSIRVPTPYAARAADILTHEEPNLTSQTTKQIGDAAESEAANYLVRLGHQIIDRNWKTKFCEIDIISYHDDTIYFTEVKYRKTDKQGGGLAAITTQKQRQMKFAAEYYALKNQLKDTNLRLAAIDMTGQPPIVLNFLKLG
ncbi:MAG TPA: ribonuclease HII [Candidatus Saccharimonadales bacterium]